MSRSSRELIGPAILMLASVLVPLGWRECYPYTRMALFTDADTVTTIYEVRDSVGHLLPLTAVRLHRAYVGLQGFSRIHPEPHPGAVPPWPTLHRFGVIAPESEVRAAVRQLLRPGDTVVVTQRVIGPVGPGVDNLAEHRWRIGR